jgi:2-polyprenyl-6-methoxyphenol hydroxylase-like FAD-dependent oxidoreductase
MQLARLSDKSPALEGDIMLDTTRDTDILIVGAGPVGLLLANECARRGLRWRLIEARPSQSLNSRALAIFPRTLEIFDMAGIVAPFLQVANRVTSVSIDTHGRNLARLRFAPEESPYPFIAMVPQNVTEELLLKELRRRGGEVEYETTFVSAHAENGSIAVRADLRGNPTSIRTSFVVGCDGAHSAVRHWLNMPFAGKEYADMFLLADVETNQSLPADQLQLCPSELGPLAIFPMSATRRRIVATVDNAAGDAPPLELVQSVLQLRGPPGFQALSLHWSSYFRVHRRHVAQLRSGRFFIAGDAAHIHSPFGGQGMNTGLHDVWNLVWKLDLFLGGNGNQQLLDSYSAERLPVIKSVIETTDRMTRVMGATSALAQSLRDAIIPMVSRVAPFQHAFVQRLSELGIAYGGSPIVEGPGRRYLDDSMRGGNGILSRFLLFVGTENEPSTQEAAKAVCKSLNGVAELRTSHGEGVTLVRPDGYIACSERNGSLPVLDAVRVLLERQATGDSELHGELVA